MLGMEDQPWYESLNAQSNDQAQGRDLLEDWPQRTDASAIAPPSKQVTISPFSQARKYTVDESTNKPSYSSKERKLFQDEATLEAFRI